MTKTRSGRGRKAALVHALPANRSLHLVPVARHGRPGLLRTTALQAVALFGLVAGAAQQAAAQPAPNARPQGGVVVGGAASIGRSATTTSVTQSTDRAALDWRSFDVGSRQTVTFTAPAASSVTLNRVTGPDPSQIAGHIVANDQLVIVNQSGVVFSKGAQVDTAGLVVSASGISPERFMRGSMTFDVAPHPGAKIKNEGRITVRDRGLAALVAPQVANEGVITARMGHVVLAGAEAHTVDLYGDGMLSINVTKQVTQASLDGKTVDALVTNTGVVRADGGTVTLTAQAVDGLVTTLVSAGGRISADSVGRQAGTVLIEGVGGSVRVTGDVSAKGAAPGAQGGQVEVNATGVASVAAGARIDASGSAGGGLIALGTTLARAHGGPSVKPALTARAALVEKGATLAADATASGAGGHVTVLSTGATVFQGAITARGGAAGGAGGQAEVSGGSGFALTGTADLTAPRGARGALLIDPTDLEIVAGAGNFDSDPGLNGATHTLAAGTPDVPLQASTVGTATLTALGATSDLTLQASRNLTVTAAVDVKNALTLQAGNDLVVNNAITTGGALTLQAAAPGFADSTTTGMLTLNGGLSAGGAVALSAGTNGVSAQSSIGGASLTVTTTGALAFGAAGTVNVGGGTVDVTSAGITQPAGSSVTAGLFKSSGVIAGAANLLGTGNVIAALGDVTVRGDFKLVDSVALTVAGTIDASAAGNVSLKVGGGGTGPQTLTFGGATVPGVLKAATGKTVSLVADAIAVGAAAGSGASTGRFGVIEIAPFTPNTDVAVNGASAAGTLGIPLAALTLNDGFGGTLRLGEAGGVTTARNIQFVAPTDVTPLGTLDLEASDAVTQSAGSVVKITALTGNAGSLDLSTEAANQLATLSGFTATGGDFKLIDANPLRVFGLVSAKDVALTVTQAGGAITLGQGEGAGAVLTAAAGGTVSLTSDKLLVAGPSAAVNADKGTIAIAPFDNVAVVIGGEGATVELPDLTAATVVIGKVGATTTASSILFAVATDFGAAGLDVETTGGSVTQQAAAGVSAAQLSGTFGSLDFTTAGAADAIGKVGPLTATAGDISLTDTAAIALTGDVTAGSGKVTLVATGGSITQPAGQTVSAGPFGSISITASGSILFGGTLAAPSVKLTASGGGVSESPAGGADTGAVQTTTLTATAGAGAIDLSTPSGAGKGNQVATLDASKATGDFTLADGAALSVSGTSGGAGNTSVSVAAGGLTLGNLVIFPGSLSAGAGKTLSVLADSIAVAALGSGLSAPGGGTIAIAPFTPGSSISVGGISSTGTLGVSLASLNLTTGAGGTLRLGNAATTKDIAFATGLDLTGTSGSLDLEASGAVTQGAGDAVKAFALTGTAGSVDLTTEPANAFGALGGFTATAGDFKLTQAAPLAVTGMVSATNIALTVTQAGGAITLGDVEIGKGVLTAGTGDSVSLRSDKLLLGAGGGSVSAHTGTISIAPFANTAMTIGGKAATVQLPGLDAGVIVLGKVGAATTATAIQFAAASNFGAARLDVEASGAVSQTAAGAVTAGSLTGLAGSIDLTLSATNAIGSLGPLTATSGGLGVTNDQDIATGGALTAASGAVVLTSKAGGGTPGGITLSQAVTGATIALSADGAIVQTGGGLSAGTLSAKAAGGQVKLDVASGAGAGNQVGTLAASSATGDFAFVDGESLVVNGAVSGAGNTSVTVALGGGALTLGGALPGSLSAGTGKTLSITADSVVKGAAGDALSAPGGGTIAIAPFTPGTSISVGGASGPGVLGLPLASLNLTTGAGGTLRLGDAATTKNISFATGLDLTGTSGTLDLEASGAVTQGAGDAVKAVALTGTAGSLDLTTEPANAFGALRGFTATAGDFKLTQTAPLAVTGGVSATNIALTVTQAGGAITLGGATKGSLTAGTGDGVSLRSDELLLGAGGGSVSAHTGKISIAPFANTAMTVGGAGATVQLPALDAGVIVLGKAGAAATATSIQFAAASDFGAARLDVEASGAVSQTAAGAVTAGVLTGSAGSIDLSMSATNAIGSLGPLTATSGGLAVTNDQDLSVGGALTAASGAVALTSKAGGGTPGNLAIGQPVTGATIALSADGAITQTGGGLSAGTLSAKAAGGQIKLDIASGAGVGNQVGTLAASSATGDFAFADGSALVVNGAVSGAHVALTVSLAGASLTLGDNAGGAASVTATAAVNPSVTLQADLMRLGTAGGTATAIGGLVATAPFTKGTDFGTLAAPLQLPTVVVGAGTLTVGAIGGVTTARNILFGSPVSLGTTGTLDLEATGAVSQLAAAGVTAGVLEGTVGSLDFLSSGAVNNIGALGNIMATTGSIAVGSGVDLVISQSITATSVALTSQGLLTQTAGTILATDPAGFVDLTAAGKLSVGGVLHATNVALVSKAGDVTEAVGSAAPSGVIQAGVLTGSAVNGAALLNTASPSGGGNQVAQLGAFATKGALTLLDGETLTVADDVSGGDVTLTVNGGNVVQNAAKTILASGALSLTATGGISFGGTLSAASVGLTTSAGDVTEALAGGAPTGLVQTTLLTGSAPGGSALLNTPSAAGSGNQVAQLGSFATTGSLTLLDGETLAVTGPASSSAGDVVLTTKGAAADLTVASTVIAHGAATLTAGRAIGVTGTVQAGSAASLTATGDVTQSGLVTGLAVTEAAGGSITHAGTSAATGGAATLTAGAAISQTGGTISAAGGDVTLGASGGSITQGAGAAIGDATAGQTIHLTAAAGISLGGTVSAASNLVLTAQGGDVAESGGIVQASLLTGSASGAALLSTTSPAGAGNLVAQLGSFATKGALTLLDGEALTVVDAVSSSAGDVTLTVSGGTLSQNAGLLISAPTGAINLAASSGLAFAGTLAAKTVSLTSQGGNIAEALAGGPSTGVIQATLLTGSAPGGSAALTTPSPAGGGNLVARLGPFATKGALTLLDGEALTVVGATSSSGGDVTLTAAGATGDIAIASSVTAAGTASLTAGRDVTQSGLVSGATVTETAGRSIGQSSGTILATAGALTLAADGGSITQNSGAVISDSAAGQTISLTASAGIAFGGTLTTPGSVSLVALGGDVSETAAGASAPSGVVIASALSGSATGEALLNTASPGGSGNLVAGLGSFTTGGDFTLIDGTGLTVSGPVTASAGATPGDVTITVDGAANNLLVTGAVTAAGAASLSAGGVLTITGSVSGSGISESSGGLLTESGNVITGGSLTLTAGGGIIQTAGTLMAGGPNLTLTANGGSILQAAGALISDPGAGAAISLTASGGIAFGGVLTTPGTVNLVAKGGDVTETEGEAAAPSGLVLASLLTGSASGQGLFTTPSPAGTGNLVAQLGPFAAGGSLTFLDGEALTVVGATSSAGGDATLTAAGDLIVSSSVTAQGAATLTAGRALGVTAAGSVQAGGAASLTAVTDLTQSGAVSGASVAETAGGSIAHAGTSTATAGGATLLAGGAITQPSGAIQASGGDATLTAQDGAFSQGAGASVAALSRGHAITVTTSSGIAFGGVLTTPGSVSLVAQAGDVSETAVGAAAPSGAVIASALSGSATGEALLNTASPSGAGNLVSGLGSFTTGGDFALTDGAGLTVSGPVTASAGATPGAVAITVNGAANNLLVSGAVTAAGSASLSAGGAITQASGSLTATGGNVILTASGGPILQSAGAAISDPGATATISLTAAGGIAFGGVLTTPGTVNLVAQGGDVTETADEAAAPTGVVLASLLTGSASGKGLFNTASPSGAGNLVAQLGPFAAGGSLTFLDGEALTVVGATSSSAGDVAITVAGEPGDLTVSSSVTARGAATLVAGGAITQTAGTISAAGGDATLAAQGGAFSQSPGASVAALSGSHAILVTASAGIAFGGVLTTPGSAILVAQGGDVTETAAGGTVPTGVLIASALSGSATGEALLNTPSPAGSGNLVTAVGSYAAGGDFVLTDGAGLTVSGAVTASAGATPGAVTITVNGPANDLAVAGAVTAASSASLSAGGALTVAGEASVAARSFASLTSGGALTEAGSVSGSTVSETSGGLLTQSGTVASTNGPLTLTSAAGIAQPSGTALAVGGNVTVAANGGSILQSAGATISDPGAAATISLTASGGIAFGGVLTTPGTVTLVAKGGDVTETASKAAAPSGVVLASLLTGSASGQGLFTTASPAGAGNLVGQLGPFAAGGSLTLFDGEALAVVGATSSSGGDVALTSAGDLIVSSSVAAHGAATLAAARDVTQSGLVSGASLSETAGRAIAQSAGTIQATAGALTLTAQGGAITQAAGATISDAGASQTATLTASSGIAFGGLISSPGTVRLVAQGGDVTETAANATAPSGVVIASALNGSASGRALLNTASTRGAGNLIAGLGQFSTGGDFVLFDGEGLAVAGPVTSSAGAVTIAANGAESDLSIGGLVTAAGSAALSAGGAILQTSGAITANGPSLTLTAQGGSITQASGALISDPAPGAAVALSASSGISFGGTISTPGSVNLVAGGGDVIETGGVVRAFALTGAASGKALLGTASPTGGGNLIAQLGAFATGGDFILFDGQALTITGAQSGANVTVTVNGGSITESAGGTLAARGTLELTASGGIAIAGTLAAPTATLFAQGGSIAETAPGGVVQFGTLSGSATGDVTLATPSAGGGGNQVAQVGSLAAGGSLTLLDGVGLTVAGPVTARAGTATITLHGGGAALTVNGTVSASGALVLSTDADLTQAGAATGASVTETAGGTITHSGTSSAATGDATLTAGGAILQPAGLVAATAGNVTLAAAGAGGIAFGGTLSAASTITLTASGGDVSETASGAAGPTGVLLAPLLTGNASGQALLLTASGAAAGNQVAQLGAFKTGGAFGLVDGPKLLVAGPVTAANGPVALTAGGSGITLAGVVTAPLANLVATGGDVVETGSGILAVTQLTGSAAGVGTFGNANQVARLGPFAAGAGFLLADAAGLTVNGSVTTTQGPVSLTVSGAGANLTQSAGTISTGGAGAVTLTVLGGGITQATGAVIGDTDPANGVTLVAQNGIALGGTVAAQGSPVSLTARTGSIAENAAGVIQAASLTGTAAGAARFDAPSGAGFGNQVGRLGTFVSGGGFELLDGTALTVAGQLSAQSIDIETQAAVTLAASQVSVTRIAGADAYLALLRNFPMSPGNTYDVFIKAANLTQTGQTSINQGAPAPASGNTPTTTFRIDLDSAAGAVTFTNLNAPSTQLFLSLANGTAAGPIDVAGLHVATEAVAGGAASLTGMVAGRPGTAAASVSTIVPLHNGKYRINACPIASVNCILLSPIVVPITNPVQDVEVGNTNNRQDDPDLILPNVGEQDF